MADARVTMDAREHVATGFGREHMIHKILVTMDTSILNNFAITRFDLDRVFEVARRERERMKETVVGFGDPFADRVMREMTIVAGGDVMVARFKPAVILRLHHVAVRTRSGVVD